MSLQRSEGHEHELMFRHSQFHVLSFPRKRESKISDESGEEEWASFVCSLLAFACFLPGLIAAVDPGVLNPSSGLVNDVACVSILAGVVGLILAIAAFSSISQRRSPGRSRLCNSRSGDSTGPHSRAILAQYRQVVCHRSRAHGLRSESVRTWQGDAGL